MKNTLKIIALSAVFVGSLFAVEGLSGKVSVGFESEYLSKGKQVADESVQVSVEGSYKLYNGSLYAGIWSNNPQTGTATVENDLYIGYKLPVFEKYTADVGMTYYWYTESNPTIDSTREIYAGVTYSGLYVNPAVYAFYDFDLEQFDVQVSGKYSYDLAKYGWSNTVLDVGAKVGVINTQDVDAGTAAGDSQNAYTYGQVSADVVYSFSKTTTGSVGVRYAFNNDSATSDKEQNLFWGAKLSAGF